MSLLLDQAIDYSQKASSHPRYRPNRIIPLTGSNVTIGNSTSESQIEVVQTVYNLSKSTLDFNLNVAVPVLVTPLTSGYHNLHTLGANMIDSIELRARTGNPIATITNADIYTRSVLPYVEKYSDYMTYDSALGSTTEIKAGYFDKGGLLWASNDVSTVAPKTALAYSGTRVQGNASDPSDIYLSAGHRAYVEPQYFKQSALNTSVNTAFSINLRQLAPHTFMSLNTDAYMGQALILRINWNPKAKLGWQSSNADGDLDVVPITAVVNVTNLRLTLQVEQNEAIRQSLVQRVMTQGMNFTIPYVNAYSYTTPKGSSCSHIQRFNSTHGSKLLNIYTTLANGDATSFTNQDIANEGAAVAKKVLSFQPSINSVNTTETRINCELNDDYQLMKDQLAGCVISNSNVYAYNRVYNQSFRGGRTCDYLDHDDVVDGKDLDVELNFVMDYTTNSIGKVYRSFIWAITQKQMNVAPGGLITVL